MWALLLFILIPAHAVNVWNDELQPTFREAAKKEHLSVLGAGVLATWGASPFNGNVRSYRNDDGDLLIGKHEGRLIDRYTYGTFQVALSSALLLADTKEGVRLSKALIFTSLSHLMLSNVLSHQRPRHSGDHSLPSGHTASMFALAGTVSGSYGWKAALPAYAAATLTALSRIKEDDHWLSDVVAGMFLGTYWARVVHGEESPAYTIVPVRFDDGLMISVIRDF